MERVREKKKKNMISYMYINDGCLLRFKNCAITFVGLLSIDNCTISGNGSAI